jgi:hypothetical protein
VLRVFNPLLLTLNGNAVRGFLLLSQNKIPFIVDKIKVTL